jgi:hypothetical protein
VPFEVTAPTRFEHEFIVRDFGVSMTHETVMNTYTTVFESTKDTSNDEVGGFGMGGKTPFAIGDEFSVTCYLEGEARLYSMCIGARGEPTVSLMGAFPTEEPNGVEVRFAVPAKDVEKFQEAIRTVAAGFDPVFKCNITGLHTIDVKERIGSILISRQSHHGGGGARVRCGCVLYPITETDGILRHVAEYWSAARAMLQDRRVAIPRASGARASTPAPPAAEATIVVERG